jgi:hypothetical protein
METILSKKYENTEYHKVIKLNSFDEIALMNKESLSNCNLIYVDEENATDYVWIIKNRFSECSEAEGYITRNLLDVYLEKCKDLIV